MSAPSRWTVVCLAVAMLTACNVIAPGTATTPSPSPPAFAGRVGMNTHFYMGPSQGDPLTQMRFMKAAGVTIIREPIKWDQVQPVPGVWKWQLSDALMAASARTGVDVLAVLCCSAPWASSDPLHRDTFFPPSNPVSFRDFAAAVAYRYGAGGAFWRAHPELAARPLAAVELWNEPWSYTFWKPAPDPAAYLAAARPAAQAVKAISPTTKVLVSGDLIEATRDARFVNWVDALLRVAPDIASWADAFSVHPYPNPGARGPLDETIDPRLRFSRLSIIRQTELARHVSLPVWVTEIGWATGPNRTEQVDDATQARYITDAVTRAVRDYGDFVQQVFVFSWDVSSTTSDQAYGLRRSDGTPKSAWTALAHLLAE